MIGGSHGFSNPTIHHFNEKAPAETPGLFL